ncbi:MAG: hypothetical protein ACR2NZ_04045 [Rubripirellula sp.]
MSDADEPGIGNDASHSERVSGDPINPYAAPTVLSEPVVKPFPRIGSVLAQGLSIWMQNWIAIAVVIGIVWVPMEFLTQIIDYEVWFPESGAMSWVIALAEFSVDSFATPTVLFIAIAAASGKPITAWVAMRRALRVWLRFMLTYLLLTLVLTISFAFLIIPGLFLSIALSLTDSVIVQEKVGGVSALRRSYDLSLLRFWSLAGVCVSLAVILIIPWVIYVAIVFTYPSTDTWQTSFAYSLFFDAIATYPTICLYLAYRQLASP